jgi:phosphatidylglycerol:prolipoprotein diacylglycerol transferase
MLFGFALFVGLLDFFIHYFYLNPLKKSSKLALFIWPISLVVAIISATVAFDGYAYLGLITFPLPRGIPTTGRPVVAFYALFILTGALMALAITEHEFYKKYGRHGIAETLFYVAFPSGIIGSRLWYVIGNWTRDGFDKDFWSIFRIWEGGLAIMGGAIFGALGGIIYFLVKFRKTYSLSVAIDIVIPTLLLAQAIGRFGNFFNQEVFGAVADINDWWFLPYAIRQNMIIEGEFRVPLFIVESFINLTGFFLIYFGIGKGLKKFREPLDMGIAYFLWYGITRAILEPLRDPRDNMGENGQWSYIWALIFVGLSIVAFIVNHVVRYILKKKKKASLVTNDGEVATITSENKEDETHE